MSVLLQRHAAKYIYAIPEGLRELMSDITREVLRTQPTNMYNFIADYLDALMITRENARVAAKTVENITRIGVTIVELLQDTGMTLEEAKQVSEIMQKSFRKYVSDWEVHKICVKTEYEEEDVVSEILEEAQLPDDICEKAAIIIQRAFRNFKIRQEKTKELLMGMIDWRVAARSTMRLYRKLDVTYEEANRAATLIKAAYKGYYTRRVMKRILEQSEEIALAKSRLAYEELPFTFGEYEESEREEEELYEGEEFLYKKSSKKGMVKGIIDTLLYSIIPSETTIMDKTTYMDLTFETESVEQDTTIHTEIIKLPIDETDVSLTDIEESAPIIDEVTDAEMYSGG
ncbi:hypothetical protein FQA39_LY15798 [Lamprigera yunnana]|nr:hypothetical protein FQA39_LY15798 [Lamprigera yunnana]